MTCHVTGEDLRGIPFPCNFMLLVCPVFAQKALCALLEKCFINNIYTVYINIVIINIYLDIAVT